LRLAPADRAGEQRRSVAARAASVGMPKAAATFGSNAVGTLAGSVCPGQ
jgi:hypothetical protein